MKCKDLRSPACGTTYTWSIKSQAQWGVDARVTAILQRRDGSPGVGTDSAEIYQVTGDSRVTRVVTDPALEPDLIWRMVEGESGALWIAGVRALPARRHATRRS